MSAYSNITPPRLPSWDTTAYPYAVLVFNYEKDAIDWYQVHLNYSSVPFTYDTANACITNTASEHGWRIYGDDGWTAEIMSTANLGLSPGLKGQVFQRIWTNHDILDDNGVVYLPANSITPVDESDVIEPEASGTCGPQSRWSYDRGVLTISGEGGIQHYLGSSESPWFGFKPSIKRVVIEEGITFIGSNSFHSYPRLGEVSIPETVTLIGIGAFFSCDALLEVKLPSKLEVIGDSAFGGCGSLKVIDLPSTLTYLGSQAFCACWQLRYINAGATSPLYHTKDGVLLDSSETKLISCPVNKPATHYNIPSTVRTIEEFGLYNCKMSTVTIPEGVTSIGHGAFEFCYNLLRVTIPSTVTEIKSKAFKSCTALKKITMLSETPPTLEEKAFQFDDSLEEIIVPAGCVDAYKTAEMWSTFADLITDGVKDYDYPSWNAGFLTGLTQSPHVFPVKEG